ncbi:MAG TPA: protein YgfX [Gallionella sp.]|nr:protein YgfX [Gallionella sp.]
MPSGRFVIQRSQRFMLVLLSVHLFVLCSVAFTDLSPRVRFGFFSLILLSFFHLISLHLRPAKRCWLQFSLDKLRIAVVTRAGAELAGDVMPQTVVTPYFVLLRIKYDGHRLPVSQVIFPDALPEDAFRELCVRLKYAQ